MRKLLALLFFTITLGMAQGANAGPFEDGEAAQSRGDYATALSLLRPLAAQGNAKAQFSLGLMYDLGHGVVEDSKEAVKWYRLAAAQGDAWAQLKIGFMYQYGTGVVQDHKEAVKWYRLAAAQGDASAQNALGFMYRNGNGVAQNYVRAHMWYNLSASIGYSDASKFRDYVATKMTSAQIAQAQELAQRCQASSYKQCGEPEIAAAVTSAPKSIGSTVLIPMKKQGGIYVVPVLINNTLTLDFMVDSGASDVTIPEDVVRTLVRTGTIKDTDFTGEQTYILADGSKVKSKTFRIRSLKVGDRVLENVTGSVASTKGSLLLGQSFLGRFKSWSIDNAKHALVLE